MDETEDRQQVRQPAALVLLHLLERAFEVCDDGLYGQCRRVCWNHVGLRWSAADRRLDVSDTAELQLLCQFS